MTQRVTIDDTLMFYYSLLEDLGVTIDCDGFTYFDFDSAAGDRIPITIDDKHLFLPTRERLKEIDSAKTIAFHPLCQNVLRGDSKVFMALKKYMAIQLTTRLHGAMGRLGELAITPELHEDLKPKQAAFLKEVTDYKKRTHTALRQLLKQVDFESRDKALISMYVKKGGKIKNRQYSQACIVGFPLRESMEETDGVTVHDVKFYSHKDKAAVEALFDYILPDQESYSQGSTSSVAPNFDALIKSFYKVAHQLNKVFDRFEAVIPEFEGYKFGLEWWDMRDILKEMSLQIPALSGNDGEAHRDQEDEAALRRAAAIHTGTPETPVEQPQEPVKVGFSQDRPTTTVSSEPAPAPAVADSGGVEWGAAKQAIYGAPQQPQAPGYGYGYGQPQGGFATQGYGYAQQPAPAGWGAQPQPAPVTPGWGATPNYNSGYVPRAQQGMGGPVGYQGNAMQQQPPWVATSNPGVPW